MNIIKEHPVFEQEKSHAGFMVLALLKHCAAKQKEKIYIPTIKYCSVVVEQCKDWKRCKSFNSVLSRSAKLQTYPHVKKEVCVFFADCFHL